MAEQQVHIELAAGPEAVWELVGDFAGIAGWLPGLDSCRLEGDVRVIGMGGMEIREQLLERDDAARTLVYSVVGGAPVDTHRATVAVQPLDGGSRVTWTFAVEPEEMAPIFADVYQKGLEALAARLG